MRFIALSLCLLSPLAAQTQTTEPSIDARLKALEERVNVVEVQSVKAVPAPPIKPLDGEGGQVIVSSVPGVPKIFLPDIGISGDFAYERHPMPKSDPRYGASRQQPRIRDGGVVFFSPIDPYTKAQFTIDLPENGVVNIEEAWLYFDKLPCGAAVRLGRYLPRFGLLDQMDTFQLSFLNRPNALKNYIGDGMDTTGADVNFYVPNPWELGLKVDLNAVRGDTLGGGAESLDLSYLGTLDYSQDLFTSGSLEAGVSVAQGPTPVGSRQETLYDPYVQLTYAPSQRHVWTWSAEGMLADRRGLGSENFKKSFYTYLDYNFALRYHVGLLADVADSPIAPYGRQLALAPNFTWFISDNTRLRVQYTHTTPLGPQRPDEAVALQATFSLGNLKQLQ